MVAISEICLYLSYYFWTSYIRLASESKTLVRQLVLLPVKNLVYSDSKSKRHAGDDDFEEDCQSSFFEFPLTT